MAILNNSNAISSGSYDINNSLRFRSSASAYLSRTPASAGNRKTWTWSGWVKRGTLSAGMNFFAAFTNTSNRFALNINATTDTLQFSDVVSGTATAVFITTQVFRDPSAWYHIILAYDTTQATASNRVKLYVNGNQVTDFSSTNYPTQNSDGYVNNNIQHYIATTTGSGAFFDGYMTEVNFIDGQALTPSSFGETDTTTGVWKPKAYTGTYGTNGFYLKFSDIATTSGSNAGLGKDFSGNTNYWTTNNISVTAGTTYDAMIDSPTLTSATVANYAVLNPVIGNSCTYSQANLYQQASGTWKAAPTTILLPSTGKYYFEATLNAAPVNSAFVGVYAGVGVIAPSAVLDWSYNSGTSLYITDTGHYSNYSAGSSGSFTGNTTGTIIGMAIDRDTNQMTIYQNNVSKAVVTIGITAGSDLYAFSANYDGSYGAMTMNFGQRPFTYTPPTGFVRLNTYNLPDSTIKKGSTVMDATLYTGTGSAQTITNAGSFKPDFVWQKARSEVANHRLVDSVRGVDKVLYSSSTAAEATTDGVVDSFNSNGFTGGGSDVVTSGQTAVAWQWQAGQGTTSSNTSGSITSTVSVNATAGFSIVTYTTPASGSGWTIGHGLGVAPKLIIAKSRSNAVEWVVYHASIPNTQYLALNTTIAASTITGAWNNTSPTSTVFTNGSTVFWGASYTYVAYCWAEIAGFSKFGSYTGNGSTDGPMVFTGFRPKFIMFKRTDAVESWYIWDTSTTTYNAMTQYLVPNTSAVEGTFTFGDYLSNGFKVRNTAGGLNASGGTFIYMAFAENPFKNANAR
jgi:hypothetical protein